MEPNLRIYACGGCGANLIQTKIDIPVAPGFPKVKPVMIDTSTANYIPSAGIEFYQIPGINGTGRDRGASLDIGLDKIEPILKDHKPGTMNVVICSGGGGTGSVIGLLIMRELLSRGLPAILMIVCSSSSGIDTDNSYKTLLSLQKVVNATKRPLPFIYYENTPSETGRIGDGPRDLVDQVLVEDLRALALTVSEQHSELDRQDIANWLNYPQVTDVPAQLVELKLMTGQFSKDNIDMLRDNVIGTLSVLTSTEKSSPALNQPYDKTGYYSEALASTATDMTWFLSAMNVKAFAESLDKANKRFAETSQGLAAVTGLAVDDSDDDALVI
jgi:hypothetical protein